MFKMYSKGVKLYFINFDFKKIINWGCSSFGRASGWHSEGSRFDPDQLHQKNKLAEFIILYLINFLVELF